MVRCARCGWSFDSQRLAREKSCPRCRLRDGIQAPLEPVSTPGDRNFLEAVSEATKRLRPSPPSAP